MQAGVDLFELVQRLADPRALVERAKSIAWSKPRVGHQDSTTTRLVPGGMPDFDEIIGQGKTVQAFRFPKASPGLQIDSRHRNVLKLLD